MKRESDRITGGRLSQRQTISLRAFVRCTLLAAAVASSASAGEKQELKWRPFEAGFTEAKKTNKKIMIDVYTDWCLWCKRLDRDVYGNDQVAAYLNRQYITIKLNAESNAEIQFNETSYTEASLAQAFGVTGYPAIIFFDSNGEPLDKLGGYVPADQFLPVIKYFGDDIYKTMSWNEFRQQTEPTGKPKSSKKK